MNILFKNFLLTILILYFFTTPANATEITSPYGWRVHPISGEWTFHTGVDLGYEDKSPIVAILPGTVIYATKYGGYGNCVILEHDNKDYTLYAHASSIVCNYGDYVDAGQIIAYVGSTGYSTGPHLHLEWWHNGEYSNPISLLNGENQ